MGVDQPTVFVFKGFFNMSLSSKNVGRSAEDMAHVFFMMDQYHSLQFTG